VGEFADLFFIGDIAHDVEAITARLDDETDRLLGTHGIDVGAYHPPASAGELYRKSATNSTASPCNNRVRAVTSARRLAPPQEIHQYRVRGRSEHADPVNQANLLPLGGSEHNCGRMPPVWRGCYVFVKMYACGQRQQGGAGVQAPNDGLTGGSA